MTDIDKYPSNNREPERRPEIRGNVRVRKPKQDGFTIIRDVTVSLFESVLGPSIRNMLADFFFAAVETAFYGGTPERGYTRGGRGGYSRRRDYDRVSARRGPSRGAPRYADVRSRRSNAVEEVFFDRRGDADNVLATLLDRLVTYEYVTLGEYYSLVGISTTPSDENWGWWDLRGTTVRTSNEGYYINLPNPKEF